MATFVMLYTCCMHVTVSTEFYWCLGLLLRNLRLVYCRSRNGVVEGEIEGEGGSQNSGKGTGWLVAVPSSSAPLVPRGREIEKNEVADPWGGDELACGKDENNFGEEAEFALKSDISSSRLLTGENRGVERKNRGAVLGREMTGYERKMKAKHRVLVAYYGSWLRGSALKRNAEVDIQEERRLFIASHDNKKENKVRQKLTFEEGRGVGKEVVGDEASVHMVINEEETINVGNDAFKRKLENSRGSKAVGKVCTLEKDGELVISDPKKVEVMEQPCRRQ
ncbi:LOW QUALITY PROTEIN: hypothetical protein Cgig2_022827 [Carnegiea gigantea]|uniref:Uncharacterized protein n=1 Tax=Carnegiea gigantea TaxID=171969 RepID=A0A9Q1KPC0_9CARY|nr:LOW QUALITY PROTEIN: hypothetical protein Cgig2_022827 [Carnegiea gigantea]